MSTQNFECDDSTACYSVIESLPDEILTKILSYVQHDDLFGNVRLVCHRFNNISYDESLWGKVIDLVRPHTQEQIALLAFTVLPSLGANLRVLKITGTHDVSVLPNDNEPMTLPRVVLQQIKDSCTGLRTFVISKCRFDLEPGFQDHLPGTLETLEFHGCRLPWTTGDPGALMENLVTLKIEYSSVDIRFVRYMCHRSPLKHLSLRGSSGVVILVFFNSPHRPPTEGSVRLQQLKVLDLSDTGMNAMFFLRDLVLDNVDCKLTHLYLERCALCPCVAHHVTPTIEFVSIAGSDPLSTPYAMMDLRAWARLSSIKKINASGGDHRLINATRRDELVRQHPNVVFDLSEDFKESPRYF